MKVDNPSDASHYSYRVVWSPEDGEFVATCAEFPSLSWLAESQTDALTGLRSMVTQVLSDMVDNGEVPPSPLMERTYSGKFNLRVGPSLHRELSLAAADAGLSLNQYVVRRLVGT